jgi:hypothetical protein
VSYNGGRADDKAGVVGYRGGDHIGSPRCMLLSTSSTYRTTSVLGVSTGGTTGVTRLFLRWLLWGTHHDDVLYHAARDITTATTSATESANNKCYDTGNYYSGPDIS